MAANLPLRALLALPFALMLGGCMVGPKYVKPAVPMTPGYKEAPDAYKEVDTQGNQAWQPVHPSDATKRGEWWTVFGESQLDRLEPQIAIANQSLKDRG